MVASGLTRANSNDCWLHHGAGLSPTKSQRGLLGPLIFEVGETLKIGPPLQTSAGPPQPFAWIVQNTDPGNYPVPTGPRPRTVFGDSAVSKLKPAARRDYARLRATPNGGFRGGLPEEYRMNESTRRRAGGVVAPQMRALPRSVSRYELRRQTSEEELGMSFGRSTLLPKSVSRPMLEPTSSSLVAKLTDAPRVWTTATPSPRRDVPLSEGIGIIHDVPVWWSARPATTLSGICI